MTVRQIEKAALGRPRGLTLAGLDRALGWKAGSAEEILEGGDPEPLLGRDAFDSRILRDLLADYPGGRVTSPIDGVGDYVIEDAEGRQIIVEVKRPASYRAAAEAVPVGLGLDADADGLTPEDVAPIRAALRELKRQRGIE